MACHLIMDYGIFDLNLNQITINEKKFYFVYDPAFNYSIAGSKNRNFFGG